MSGRTVYTSIRLKASFLGGVKSEACVSSSDCCYFQMAYLHLDRARHDDRLRSTFQWLCLFYSQFLCYQLGLKPRLKLLVKDSVYIVWESRILLQKLLISENQSNNVIMILLPFTKINVDVSIFNLQANLVNWLKNQDPGNKSASLLRHLIRWLSVWNFRNMLI